MAGYVGFRTHGASGAAAGEASVYDVPRHLSTMSRDITAREGWDSNPRGTRAPNGFQDRRLRPLGHPPRGDGTGWNRGSMLSPYAGSRMDEAAGRVLNWRPMRPNHLPLARVSDRRSPVSAQALSALWLPSRRQPLAAREPRDARPPQADYPRTARGMGIAVCPRSVGPGRTGAPRAIPPSAPRRAGTVASWRLPAPARASETASSARRLRGAHQHEERPPPRG
jgi:hypothetical protein